MLLGPLGAGAIGSVGSIGWVGSVGAVCWAVTLLVRAMLIAAAIRVVANHLAGEWVIVRLPDLLRIQRASCLRRSDKAHHSDRGAPAYDGTADRIVGALQHPIRRDRDPAIIDPRLEMVIHGPIVGRTAIGDRAAGHAGARLLQALKPRGQQWIGVV